MKWVADNNAEVTDAEAKAWEAQSEATKNAAASAAKGVVNGLEAFVKDLSESERQRINANIQQVTPVLRAWQNLNPAAQAAIGGVVCHGAGGAIAVGSGGGAIAGGAAFAGGCSAFAYASTQAPLPQLIPEGWTPPSDDSGSGSGSGGSSQQPTPDPNDPDGDGTTEREELKKADQKLWDGEITDEEYTRIVHKFFCDSGDSYYCK